MAKRLDKHNYYLGIAEQVATNATCLRRRYGSVIVKNDEIISTGYNGSPRGTCNCTDIGFCARQKLNIAPGERYEKCRSVHSEMNAIISASRKDMIGSTLYLVGIEADTNKLSQYHMPCTMCQRAILNSGVETVVMKTGKSTYKIMHREMFIVENKNELDILTKEE